MRIVNIILTSVNGGAEQAFIDYLVALKNLGHEILAVTKLDAPYADEVEKLGIKVKKITNNLGYHDIFAISNLRNILQEFDADIVISHAGRAISLSKKAVKKITNKKIIKVAVNHSMNVKRSIGSDIILSVNKEIFFRTIDAGQREDSSFIIPNAIDLNDADADVPKVNLQKKEEIVIGVMGRLDESKGFYDAIRSIKILEKLSDKKFILKIAGSGLIETKLRSLVKDLDLENKVEFCGWIKSKKDFFSSIDIFLLSSKSETFGLVLLEAMKYFKPIISTDADGPKEILRDKQDALIVPLKPSENIDERIANAVIEMVNNPDAMNLMVENSAVRVREKFSYESLEKKLKEIVGSTVI